MGILDILGGPLAPVVDIIGKVIDRVIPDPAAAAEAKLKVDTLVQNGQLAQLAAETAAMTAQTDTNKVEAASNSVFVAGWRPFCGWIGGCGLAYAAIIEPTARFVATVIVGYQGDFPAIDTTVTMQVLFGMLGLGAMRSYDKAKGTETTGINK